MANRERQSEWFDCESCGTEFAVLVKGGADLSEVDFCPLCGADLPYVIDDETRIVE